MAKINTRLALTDILVNALDEFKCTGALCALNISGELSTQSVGSILLEDHNKQFYIYSITKTFTATALLLLCEKNGNFLDQEFSSFFPDSKIPSTITIRQLLNHTGGLSDYGSKEYQEAVNSHPDNPWSYKKLMEVGLQNTPLFEAGSSWSYSNPGYGLLKELIELIAGIDYYSFIDEFILKPTGLLNTRAFLEPDYDCQLLQADDPFIAGDFRLRYDPGWIATGCLISTVSDITRFYQALFSGGLVTEESLREMKETVVVPFPEPPPMIPAYGLGLMHGRNAPLGEAYGHGGGGPGYTTYVTHYPNLLGISFTLSLVLNKTLPETPFSLADDIVKDFIKYEKSGQGD